MSESEGGELTGEAIPVRWARLTRRRWWVGVPAALLVTLAAATLLLLSRPVWRGEARLRLSEPPPPASASPTGGILSLLRTGGDPFANDLELLGSRTVAEDVTAELALDARLVAPRGWYRDSLFASMESTRATDDATFELTWQADDRVRVDQLDPEQEPGVAEGPLGAPLRFGGLAVVPGPRRVGAPTSVRVTTVPFQEAAERFRGALDFERSRRDAYVLDITLDHADPGLARAAVEASVARFIRLRGDLYGRESDTTVDSLRVVVEQTEADLARAEAALEALQRESGLVAPGAQAEGFVERWVTVQGELETARAELSLVEATLDRMAASAAPEEAWTTLLAHPRFLENPTLGDLLTRIVALEEERVALASRRSEESREYRVLEAQISLLDTSLRSLATNYARSLRSSLDELEARERRLSARLDALPAAAIQVGSRQRDVELLTGVLVATERQLRQEEVRSALTFANIQVVDPPALVFEPVWPRKKLGAAVGLLLALGTGMLSMVVVDRADTRLRRVAEVRAVTSAPVLGTPVAGRGYSAVPATELDALRRVLRRAPDQAVVFHGLEGRNDADVVLHALGDIEGLARGAAVGGRVATVEDLAAPEIAQTVPGGAPPRVVLVVRCGRTPRGTLRRAVAVLDESATPVVGSVLLCRTRAEAEAAWT